MKPAITLAALASLFLLAGCASTPPADTRKTTTTVMHDVDHAYVNAVSRQASRAGVRVHWVNPPRKKNDSEVGRQP